MPKPKGHKWFAAIYDRLMARAEKSFMRKVREELLRGAKGHLLEIGCGTGGNFPYYPSSATQIIATDADPYMLKRARKKAAHLARPIQVQQTPAEALPFEESSFDTVVSSLVMCSVRDPAKVLAEVKRVLKPGGEFRFYEHVRYDHPLGAFCQDLITPLWSWFGAGCHPNRDTAQYIRNAGLDIAEMALSKPVPFIPPMCIVRPHIQGIARRQ